MKKILLGFTLLISLSVFAGKTHTQYIPVVGTNSAKKGVKIYPHKAMTQMANACTDFEGEVIKYTCETEEKTEFSVVACAGICKIQFENEGDVEVED